MGAAHELAELTPFVRRCADLNPDNPVRLRSVQAPGLVVTSAFAVLPFGALVERIIATPGHPLGDRTHRAAELLAWLEAALRGAGLRRRDPVAARPRCGMARVAAATGGLAAGRGRARRRGP